jgi:hypothetical protein
MKVRSEGTEITSTKLLARVEAFLSGLSRMCPSDEGMGCRAPWQAFVAKGIEGRNLLDDVQEYLANGANLPRSEAEVGRSRLLAGLEVGNEG